MQTQARYCNLNQLIMEYINVKSSLNLDYSNGLIFICYIAVKHINIVIIILVEAEMSIWARVCQAKVINIYTKVEIN